MNPLPVREETERDPRPRHQNVFVTITPPSNRHFEYYHSAQIVADRARYLSVWAYPWWISVNDKMTGFGSGIFGEGPFGASSQQEFGSFGSERFGRGPFGEGG